MIPWTVEGLKRKRKEAEAFGKILEGYTGVFLNSQYGKIVWGEKGARRIPCSFQKINEYNYHDYCDIWGNKIGTNATLEDFLEMTKNMPTRTCPHCGTTLLFVQPTNRDYSTDPNYILGEGIFVLGGMWNDRAYFYQHTDPDGNFVGYKPDYNATLGFVVQGNVKMMMRIKNLIIPYLKRLCKLRGITGYSKLKRQELLAFFDINECVNLLDLLKENEYTNKGGK
jgi:hypothetical protein